MKRVFLFFLSGIITVECPAAFNNSATARLRFYYHNGTGRAAGSRPRISIEITNTLLRPSTFIL